MKKITLLFILAIFIFSACKKDQPKTFRDILIRKIWTYTSYTVQTANDSIDYLDSIPYNAKDFSFWTDSSYRSETLCAYMPYTSNSKWYLNEKQDTLFLELERNLGDNAYWIESVQKIISFSDSTYSTKENKNDTIHYREFVSIKIYK